MSKHSLFNSFLLALCVGVTGWVAHKAAESGERIAAMQSAVESVKETSGKTEHNTNQALTRLDQKLDEMLPRREFDARLLLIEAEQRKQDIRLREIDLEILKLKSGIK